MRADSMNGLAEVVVFEHFARDDPSSSVRFIGCHDFYALEPARIERAAKEFDPREVRGDLVPDAGVINVQPVNAFGALNEFRDVVRHILRIEFAAADPIRRTPGQTIQKNARIPLFRLLHEPPLVAARVVLFLVCMHVAGLAAVGRVHVPADFHLKMLKARAEVRLEEIVQNLAALWLGIIYEQTRGGARAHRADAFEGSSLMLGIHHDGFCFLAGRKQTADRQNGQKREHSELHCALDPGPIQPCPVHESAGP